MKKSILALAFLVSSSAYAAQDFKSLPLHKKCTLLAGLYSVAIDQRNMGLPPENVLGAFRDEVPVDLRKAVINQVYFDPALRYAVASRDFSYSLIERCVNGPAKPYEPLR